MFGAEIRDFTFCSAAFEFFLGIVENNMILNPSAILQEHHQMSKTGLGELVHFQVVGFKSLEDIQGVIEKGRCQDCRREGS